MKYAKAIPRKIDLNRKIATTGDTHRKRDIDYNRPIVDSKKHVRRAIAYSSTNSDRPVRRTIKVKGKNQNPANIYRAMSRAIRHSLSLRGFTTLVVGSVKCHKKRTATRKNVFRKKAKGGKINRNYKQYRRGKC